MTIITKAPMRILIRGHACYSCSPHHSRDEQLHTWLVLGNRVFRSKTNAAPKERALERDPHLENYPHNPARPPIGELWPARPALQLG